MSGSKFASGPQFMRILLCDHSQYLDLLNTIRRETEKIVIVQIDGEDRSDVVVNTAMEMMRLEKRELVSKWYGTISRGRAAVLHDDA